MSSHVPAIGAALDSQSPEMFHTVHVDNGFLQEKWDYDDQTSWELFVRLNRDAGPISSSRQVFFAGTTDPTQINLSNKIDSELTRWLACAPRGWPDENGKTPDNKKLDIDLRPRTQAHLVPEELYSFFQWDYPYGEDVAIQKLTDFFADFDVGYTRYFLAGHFEYRRGQPVRYHRDLSYLNQLMVMLDGWANLAELQLREGVYVEPAEVESVERLKRICRQVVYHLQKELERDDVVFPFYAVMEDDGTSIGIVPAVVDGRRNYQFNFGQPDEEKNIEANWIIQNGHHRPHRVIVAAQSQFHIHELMTGENNESRVLTFEDWMSYGMYEKYLAPCPFPDEFGEPQANLKDIFILCNGDDVRQRRGLAEALTNAELLYLGLLLAQDAYGTDTSGLREKLSKDFSGEGLDFSSERIQSVYQRIPDDAKKEVYAFVYCISLGYYRGGIEKTLTEKAPTFRKATEDAHCHYWELLANVPLFLSQDDSLFADFPHTKTQPLFDEGDAWLVAAVWDYYDLQPRIPQDVRRSPEQVKEYFEDILSDKDVLADNRQLFDDLVLKSSGISQEDWVAIMRWHDQWHNFSSEKKQAFNIGLLERAHPQLQSSYQARRNVVSAIDVMFHGAISNVPHTSEDYQQKIDLHTQLVFQKTLGDLEALYRRDADIDAESEHIADAYAMIHDVLLGGFDASDPAKRQLYSRHNPNEMVLPATKLEDLMWLYSADYFDTLVRLPHRNALWQMEPLLDHIRLLIRMRISLEDFHEFMTTWQDAELLDLFLNQFDVVYAPQTERYFAVYNPNVAAQVGERLQFIRRELVRRLDELKGEIHD